MDTERDPRIDPQPGDVLIRNCNIRTVEELLPNGLVWSSGGRFICMFKTWRRWAKTATVERKAD